MAREDVIVVNNLTKRFGSLTAVDDVSFTVQKGEIFGFLGPNGAGKTTTIRCMNNFISPDSGSITMLGLDSMFDSVALKNRIGFLSADVAFYNNWTGNEHISLYQSIHGSKGKAQQLIEDFDYNPKYKVHHLSSGNKQKLGIILALMFEPEILILDEPTRGLDPMLQKKLYDMLFDLKKKGCTIFMSSHNLPEVEKVCDKIGIIRQGKMVAIETIQSMREKSLHIVTALLHEKTKIDSKDFSFSNVEMENKGHGEYTFKVKGDLNPTMKSLSKYEVKDLEVSHASLEDAFFELYKTNGGNNEK